MSGGVEFIDLDPGPDPQVRPIPSVPSLTWWHAALGWALAAGLALAAPFQRLAVYPPRHIAVGSAVIRLKGASLNGWTTHGEAPAVGIVLAICAALFASNSVVLVLRHRHSTASTVGWLDRWTSAGATAAPSMFLGVLSMLALYLTTGATRSGEVNLPVSQASSAPAGPAGGGAVVPVPPGIRTVAPAAIRIVRNPDIQRSECLWLTMAAAVFAITALAIQSRADAREINPGLDV